MSSTVKPLGNALRLEVEGDPPAGSHTNLIANPSGELGSFGWVAPFDGAYIDTHVVAVGPTYYLDYHTTPAIDQSWYSDPVRVGAAQYLQVALTVSAEESTPGQYMVSVDWLDNDGNVTGNVGGPWWNIAPTTARILTPITPPAGNTSTRARVRINAQRVPPSVWPNGSHIAYRDVQLIAADTIAGLVGPVVGITWVNVLGPTHDITITRERFNVSTLSANIVDSTLDPAHGSIIQPGRQVRLTAYGADAEEWIPLYVGRIAGATVEYALKAQDPDKRAHIVLNAVDAAQTLANSNSNEGVLRIDQLPYVLEKVTPAIPWDCDDNTGGVAFVDIVETSDSATAMDQLALTRDTELGYVWVSRRGVLKARSRAYLTTAVAGELDESSYTDVLVGYDTDEVVNEVTVTNSEYDAVDESNTSETYGPFRNQDSIDVWGVHHADYRTHGLLIVSDPDTYAAQILDSNAAPAVQLRTMNLHVDLNDDWSGVTSLHTWLDLYDLVEITCVRANLEAAPHRVVAIQHTISGPDSKWTMVLGFAAPSGSASAARGAARAALAAGDGWPVELPTVTLNAPTDAASGSGGGSGGPPTGPAGGDLAGSYPNPEIGVGKVGNAELADNAVSSAKIAAGAVTTTDIGDAQVTGLKLADGAVDSAKILDGSVTMTDLNIAVVNEIGNSQVNAYDEAALVRANLRRLYFLGAGVTVTDNPPFSGVDVTIPGTPVGAAGGSLAGTYPNPTLAANSVGASQITDGTVGNAELAANAVTSSKIADGTIVAADLDAALASSIANAAVDSLVVHKAGAETITGVKTLDVPLVQTYQAVAPATPPAGKATGPYFGADGLPYFKTPTGVVVPFNIGDVAGALHSNPSFEVWAGAALTGWDNFWSTNSTIAEETVDVLFGAKSLTFNIGAPDGSTQLLMSSVWTVAPGDNIDVGAWARNVSGVATMGIGIITAPSGTPGIFDGVSMNQSSDIIPLGATYARYSKSFVVPAGHTACRMQIRIAKPAGNLATAVARVDATASSRSGGSPSVLPGNSWPKEAVRALTTAVFTPTSTAPAVVDGVNLAQGDRVLKAVPGGATTDGIYTVVTVGTGANGVWQRAADATTGAQLAGAEVAVTTGTAYGGTRWRTSFRATDVVGSALMVWTSIDTPQPIMRRLLPASTGATAALTNIPWDTLLGVAVDITYDVANRWFVMPRAGRYLVKASLGMQPTGNQYCCGMIILNGVEWHRQWIFITTAGVQQFLVIDVVQCVAGDKISVASYANGSSYIVEGSPSDKRSICTVTYLGP